MADPGLQYECVVCTRNRPDALRLSIRKLLMQTRTPRRVIIVDSSDEASCVKAAVDELAQDAPCPVTLIRSAPGLTLQRNQGLRLVEADVVFFPDDDAHCDPDYAEEILAIYERDEECVIGAVIGTHRSVPRAEEAAEVARQMTRAARLRQRITVRRTKIERRIAVDPLAAIGWEYKARWRIPEWVDESVASPNCWVRGFRMTFRASALRAAGGFDETLRNYANFEDIDMGLAVGEKNVILQARRAHVFHHQAEGGRGSGFVRGATNVANRAYVVARHSPPGSRHRRQAVTYGAYRCLLYGAGSLWSSYHRDSLRGAVAVLRHIRPLLLAPSERASDAYRALLVSAGVGYE